MPFDRKPLPAPGNSNPFPAEIGSCYACGDRFPVEMSSCYRKPGPFPQETVRSTVAAVLFQGKCIAVTRYAIGFRWKRTAARETGCFSGGIAVPDIEVVIINTQMVTPEE